MTNYNLENRFRKEIKDLRGWFCLLDDVNNGIGFPALFCNDQNGRYSVMFLFRTKSKGKVNKLWWFKLRRNRSASCCNADYRTTPELDSDKTKVIKPYESLRCKVKQKSLEVLNRNDRFSELSTNISLLTRKTSNKSLFFRSIVTLYTNLVPIVSLL